MSQLNRSINQLLASIGDSCTVDGNAAKVLMTRLGREESKKYLTDAEFALCSLPVLLGYLDPAVDCAVGDLVEWNEQTLTIKKLIRILFKDQLVAHLVILG